MARLKCPRSGFIVLGKGGTNVVVPTTCKTWSCAVCKKKQLALTEAKIEVGATRLEATGCCVLITLTFVQGPERPQQNAVTVAAAWRRYLYLTRHLNLAWFRVPELTKKNQPHLHLVAGPIPRERRIRCIEQKHSWKRAQWMHSCDCLEHEISALWEQANDGASWVADVRKATSPNGAADYLGKYLLKTMVNTVRDRLAALGFARRYSRSRSWPVGEVHLLGSEGEGWSMIRPTTRYSRSDHYAWEEFTLRALHDVDNELLIRRGDDIMIALQERTSYRARLKQNEKARSLVASFNRQ